MLSDEYYFCFFISLVCALLEFPSVFVLLIILCLLRGIIVCTAEERCLQLAPEALEPLKELSSPHSSSQRIHSRFPVQYRRLLSLEID